MTQLVGSGGGGGGFKGGGGGGARTPREATDNLESTSYAVVVDLLGEGEIEGFATPSKAGLTQGTTAYDNALLKDIYFDNVPILNPSASNSSPSGSDFNFKNVTIAARFGTKTQARLPFGNEILEEFAVGLTVEQNTPITRTITDTNVDDVRITITIPALQELENDGDIVGTDVSIAIQVQYNGGGFNTVINDTIRGRSSNQYQRDYRVNLRSGNPSNFPVDIRLVRTNQDGDSTKISDEVIWSSYTEIVRATLNYPFSALAGIRVSAEQFNTIPQRTYRVRGRKVKIPNNGTVSNANGRITYSGAWNGTFGASQWTTDPAWILYDLLINSRYGFGTHIAEAQLDKWAFYSASQYCSTLVPDGFGGTEPRFSCNVSIQALGEAYKLINDLCSVMRAMNYWSAGGLTLSQDRPTDPAYLFTMANVTEEGFSYSGSDVKTRPNVAVVQYLDLDAREVAVEQVEDRAAIARYGVIQQEISAFACTSRGQASRLGEWLIYASQRETEVVSFTASIEAGVIVRPGQIIEIADPVRAGARRGGRITAATTTVVTIDSATGLPSSGTLSVILPDGTIESKACTRSGTTVTLASALSKTPNIGSVWVLNGGGIITSQWRVLTVSERQACQYEITALTYNSSKYDYIERGAKLTTRDVSNLTQPVLAPTNLALSEQLYRYQGQVRAKVLISWRPRVGVNQYNIRWRKDSGNWNRYVTQSPDHEILNITPGVFDVEIYSLDAFGRPSSSALTGTITALGKTAPPSDVTGLVRTIDPVIGVSLDWNPVSDLDLRDYEIRRGGTGWDDASFVARVNGTSYKVGILEAGSVVYRIKARDTSNVLSSNAASVTVTVIAAAAPTVTHTIDDPLATISWTSAAGSYAAAYYELRTGASFAAGTLVAKVNANDFGLPITWSGSRTFWVAAVDPVGTIGDAGSRVITITPAAAPTVTAAFYGRSCTLTWNATQGTLRTRFYEISYGDVYADRTIITRIGSDGTGYSLSADWSGSRRFWVAAVDGNGNLGSAGSVVTAIGAAPAPVLDSIFVGQNVQISWTPVRGTLETVFYEVRRGTVWGSAVLVGRVNSTYVDVKGGWLGTERFLVRAVDANGQYGATTIPETAYGETGSIDVVISAPSQPSISQQVVDNNVLLRWNDCTATLPIVGYELRRGATWAGATVIGAKQGGFTSVFETASGTYTYWLAGIDSAGNYGTPGNVVAAVNQPPDYILRLNQASTFSGTLTNMVTDGTGVAVAAVNTSETYEQHFTTRGWTTIQNQIDAGFSQWILPGQTTATYEDTIDYGAVVAGSKVMQALASTAVAGSLTITPRISIKLNVGDAWTDFNGLDSIFATNFRYIKFRYDFAGSGGDDLLQLTSLNYRIDSKLRTDTGLSSAKAPQSGTYSRTGTTITVTAAAHGMANGNLIDLDFTSGAAVDGIYTVANVTTDTFTVTSAASGSTTGNVTLHAGGTVVAFNVAFVDVEAISVTPSGTAARIGIYDFTDAPNPTTFKVLLFDTSGTRVAGPFSWSARGV